MGRNPDKEHLDVSMKGDKITATYRESRRTFPLRIARTSSWDRAIIRMIHANMRLNGLKSLTALDLIMGEFGDLMNKDDLDRIAKFHSFMKKLENKKWENLGVNV